MNIINKAKGENRSKKENYYEKHHILPKSIYPLWANRKSNTVLLTAREHFFCHQLLTKIYPGKKMNYALIKLMYSNNNPHKKEKIKISSREYERIKKLNHFFGKDNPNFGNKWSDEQRTKASERTKEWLKNHNNPNFGNKWSDEQKQKLSAKKKGRRFYTNGEKTICVFEGEEPDGFYKGHTSNFLPKSEAGKKAKYEHAKNMKHNLNTGKKWFHNKEGQNVLAFECPEGFIEGKYMSEEKLLEMKRKNSEAHKGKSSWNKGHHYKLPKRPGQHWYTNGEINTRAKDCPEGFWPGRLH